MAKATPVVGQAIAAGYAIAGKKDDAAEIALGKNWIPKYLKYLHI